MRHATTRAESLAAREMLEEVQNRGYGTYSRTLAPGRQPACVFANPDALRGFHYPARREQLLQGALLAFRRPLAPVVPHVHDQRVQLIE